MNKKWRYPALHLLGWTIMAANGYRDFMGLSDQPYYVAWIQASGFPLGVCALVHTLGYQLVLMTGFYMAYGVAGPLLYPRPRYLLALGALMGACVGMVGVRYVVEFGVLKPVFHYDNYFGHPHDLWWYASNCIGFSYDYVLFGLLLYFVVGTARARQERTNAELAFLKSQVNPHFLFNTINDIYALVYQKSEDAPEALLTLSGLLRYMLYEDGREKVALDKELAYLQDYLHLQRIGSKQRTFIDVSVTGDTSRWQIPPLLLIPFAENIIKHGVTDDPLHPARLEVDSRDGRFRLTAVNRVQPREKDKGTGIGLRNVRRRLELLYPGIHRFQVVEEAGEFHCLLDLTLHP
jgi:hypothetical protein